MTSESVCIKLTGDVDYDFLRVSSGVLITSTAVKSVGGKIG